MNEIKVGDLVAVVASRVCDGHKGRFGRIFAVASFTELECCTCGQSHGKLAYDADRTLCIGIYRLRRIPPLGDLESLEDAHDLPREKELVR